MTRGLCSLAGLACLGLLGLLAGCSGKSKSKPSDNAGGPPPHPAGPMVPKFTGAHAAGKQVFMVNCLRCHNVKEDTEMAAVSGGPMMPPGFPGPGGPGGPGGPPGLGGPPFGPGGPGRMGKKGPDLSKVGKDQAHTVDWLMQFIRDPKSKKPNAKMPAFPAAKLSDTDLRAVAEYLASLK